MPNLPPPVWGELFYSGAWNDVTDDMRVATSDVQITRGLSSESSSAAEPTSCTCDLDSRDDRYSPRNPLSPLWGLIGRNTPFRTGYTVGPPWAALPGATGSKLTTPDSAALTVTGDLDLRVEVALDDWVRSSHIAARYLSAGENRAWALLLGGTGQLAFYWSPDGTLPSRLLQFSTVPVPAYSGQRLALRVTLDVNNGSGVYEVRFYTGRTVDDTEWNLLGAPVPGAATTSVFDGTSGIEFGDSASLTENALSGKVYALKLLNGINGATAVSMKVAAGTPGGTTLTGLTGETWTVAGAAALTNKHVRVLGEVTAWPPTRDISLKDNWVSITAAGVMRRMDAGNKPTDSALLRYIKAHNPIECWPLTDGKQTGAQGAASLVGGSEMTYRLDLGTALPEWQGGKLADWSDDVIAFKAETAGQIKGRVPNSTAASIAWSVDLFLSGGGQGAAGTIEINDLGAYTDADNRIRLQLSMDANSNDIDVFRASLGDTSSSSALLTTISSAGIFNDDRPHHVRVTVDPGGSTSTWEIFLDGVSRASGTMAFSVKAVRDVAFNWSLVSGGGLNASDQQLGFITYWDGNGPSAANMYAAATGFQGEWAGQRIVRLAAESGYTATVAGELARQQRMGIQGTKKLLELMNEASDTNFGYLLERRDAAEVIHIGQSTLWNQTPALTLDFSAGLISPPFAPLDDDKLTENDVTVQREFGSVPARQVLETGALSVQAPEDGGVGLYDQSYTYSLYTDAQAAQVAGMRLHLGTYAGVRYARITLNLANERVFALIADILRVDVGDKIRLTHLPADHGPDDVDVLVAGYTETAGPGAWTITFNCVPGDPWNAGVVGSATYGRADTGGCQLAEVLDSIETGVDVYTTGDARWIDSPTYPTEFPFDVRTGGEVMRVTACDSAVRDTFTRTVANGWGTATAGGSWTTTGGAASEYAVNGSVGTHAETSINISRYCVIAAPSADVDVVVSMATSALATGGPHYVGAIARYLDANNTYYARLAFNTNQTLTLVIQKRVGGTQTDLTTVNVPGTHAAGTFFKIRLQVTGATLRAKAWPAAGTEPVVWQATVTDSSLTAAGSVGVRSILSSANTNTLPVTASYDDFAMLNPQTFTVTRGINGITKNHPQGQAISLANPVYVAM
jgi:hypothetical protein